MITLQRDFSHFPSGALMTIIANIPSRGIFHISPLELSWRQPIFPPEGLLDLPSGGHTIMFNCPSRRIFYIFLWRFNCYYSHITLWSIISILPLECFFTFPSRGINIYFPRGCYEDGFGKTSTVFSSFNSLRGYPTRFSSGREYLQILQSF